MPARSDTAPSVLSMRARPCPWDYVPRNCLETALHARMALSSRHLSLDSSIGCSPCAHGTVVPDAPIFEIGEAALHAYMTLFLKDKHHVTLNCFGFVSHQLGKPGRLEPQLGFRDSNAWICAGTPSFMKIPPSMVFVSRSIPGALRHSSF